ncbi:MAG: hypothetical protein ABSC55_16950 [Syntrophorhabdales bacterium]|jgi:hypothetical protein
MLWGIIIGLGVGAWLSYSFILPADVLNLKLAEITIGDILRILGAFFATFGGAGIGSLIGEALER